MSCMFTLCYTNNKPLHDSCQHYTGFLKTQSPTEGGVELDNKDSLRKAVESLFNKLYGKHMKYCMYKLYLYSQLHIICCHVLSGQYIHDDKARLPYSKTEEYGLKIDGLPTSCTLKHPSSYGKSTLKSILENRENLKLYGEKER